MISPEGKLTTPAAIFVPPTSIPIAVNFPPLMKSFEVRPLPPRRETNAHPRAPAKTTPGNPARAFPPPSPQPLSFCALRTPAQSHDAPRESFSSQSSRLSLARNRPQTISDSLQSKSVEDP